MAGEETADDISENDGSRSAAGHFPCVGKIAGSGPSLSLAARNLDKHNNERQPSNSTFGGAARGYGRAASTLPSIFEATLLIGAHIHELVTWAAVSDAGAFAQIASSDVATLIMVAGNGVLFTGLILGTCNRART